MRHGAAHGWTQRQPRRAADGAAGGGRGGASTERVWELQNNEKRKNENVKCQPYGEVFEAIQSAFDVLRNMKTAEEVDSLVVAAAGKKSTASAFKVQQKTNKNQRTPSYVGGTKGAGGVHWLRRTFFRRTACAPRVCVVVMLGRSSQDAMRIPRLRDASANLHCAETREP